MIRFDRERQKLVYRTSRDSPEVTLRGITKILPILYYYSYNFLECVMKLSSRTHHLKMLGFDPNDLPSASGRKHTAKRSSLEAKMSKHKGGMSLGSLVDKHVTAIINGYDIETKEGYSIRQDLQKMLADVGIHRHTSELARVHPTAQSFLLGMLGMGYKPLRAQVAVGEAKVEVGTRVDSLWRHRDTGQTTLVEMHVVKKFYYEVGNDLMYEPYERVVNSPRNQKQLQLGWTQWLYSRSAIARKYGRVEEAIVVRLQDDDMEIFPLEPWVLTDERKAFVVRQWLQLVDMRRHRRNQRRQQHQQQQQQQDQNLGAVDGDAPADHVAAAAAEGEDAAGDDGDGDAVAASPELELWKLLIAPVYTTQIASRAAELQRMLDADASAAADDGAEVHDAAEGDDGEGGAGAGSGGESAPVPHEHLRQPGTPRPPQPSLSEIDAADQRASRKRKRDQVDAERQPEQEQKE